MHHMDPHEGVSAGSQLPSLEVARATSEVLTCTGRGGGVALLHLLVFGTS